MMIALDTEMVTSLMSALTDAQKLIQQGQQREDHLRIEADANRLLSETEASAYLGRSSSSLLNYKRMGLNYYKKGREVWYRKGDIDEWLLSGKVARHRRN